MRRSPTRGTRLAGPAPAASRHHRDPRLLLLVAAGGAVGTGLRYALSSTLGPSGAWPTATLVENVVGAFVLGLLLETLLCRGPETARGRAVRLGVGTGVLGGFTTFSSLAIELERLLAAGAVGTAAAYAAASVVLGLAACFAGVAVGARWAARAPASAGRRATAAAP